MKQSFKGSLTILNTAFILLLSISLKAQTQVKGAIKNLTDDETPLVLQWEASQHRHLNKFSLLFKENNVELTTNTSSYQINKVI
ncbi:MAG: hypothetical protein OXM55_01445 [Bdellovibrionales bacterium]|nr:hypothetical protein [Bdellovibrionales bacterium]